MGRSVSHLSLLLCLNGESFFNVACGCEINSSEFFRCFGKFGIFLSALCYFGLDSCINMGITTLLLLVGYRRCLTFSLATDTRVGVSLL